MITATQVRAARALLNIDQRQLADLSGLSVPTIQRMEASEDMIRGNVELAAKLAAALQLVSPMLAATLAAWTEAVEGSRRVNSMPHCAGSHTALDLACKLHNYGAALRSAGDHFDSEGALAESAEIICDLGLPPQQYK